MSNNNNVTSNHIAVIDVETTGLSPWRNDRIVEIAIVVISPDGEIQTEYETLVNPNRDVGPTRIHGITSGEVLEAPEFVEIAGDVLSILSKSAVIAGHNVSFDKNFIMKEYERIGIAVPELPLLCTCRLFGRNSLAACCDELGITFVGIPHRALTDARVTAKLVAQLCDDDPSILRKHHIVNVEWPVLKASCSPCFTRDHAQKFRQEPPKFLQRISTKIHHDTEATTPELLAYQALIDRVLEDRLIDMKEEATLVEAALQWKLSKKQIIEAHETYIHNLAVLALADGVISEAERSDMLAVARLLGQDDKVLENVIKSAADLLRTATQPKRQLAVDSTLFNLSVCFTGELRSTIDGQLLTRDIAETLSEKAGLRAANSVTKKLDILVVADPNTQSGKARKARDYGIRILSEAVFWRMIGVCVD